MHRLPIRLAATLLAVSMGMAGTAAATKPGVDDETISRQLLARLTRDIPLAPGSITVSTRNGIVYIEGKVPSTEAAKRAIILAEATEGVRGVWVNFDAD